MERDKATIIFETLSSGIRLDIFRLLVRNDPDGLVAGEIAEHLGLPATNLSFHLKSILFSKLISVEKEGRYLRYRANIPLMLETIDYLTENAGLNEAAYRSRKNAAERPSGWLSLLPEEKEKNKK